MEENPKNEQNQTDDRLSDLPVNTDQAEEAKGGGFINFTKVMITSTHDPNEPVI